ncbi:IclR family transcriptional regulator [Actinomycetospora endophytica]|uniref:IclR family transcriptional regulator n=1 Tax=Actinomycetospora endophytica TaxID=2291215 RepID=A0ABS8PFQ7_9PSEU|nr:IclR family transcriptional regulator [Actinomycetospora endophytica]MCD2197086.1 IclR family transcriptional regulator [Actinomycetospora endophytica]
MPESPGGRPVQSLQRAFDLLDDLADAGGRATLSELAVASRLPAATIHRLLGTLVELGHVRRETGRRYALGPRLVRLGDAAGRVLGDGVRPVLADLVERTGESANLAGLDGSSAVYLAQVSSPHPMRMFTEVGAHVPLHCTGVGKALLSTVEAELAHRLVERAGMPARTPATIVDLVTLDREIRVGLERGWHVDDGEQEVGVRCVAVAVPEAPTPCAVSVSGPAARLGLDRVEVVGALLRDAARRISDQLTGIPAPERASDRVPEGTGR